MWLIGNKLAYQHYGSGLNYIIVIMYLLPCNEASLIMNSKRQSGNMVKNLENKVDRY